MTDIDDTLDDLTGFGWIPGIDPLLTGIRQLAAAAQNGHLTLDATQTLLTLLANPNGPDLPELLAHLAAHLTHPDTNPTLTLLDPTTRKTVQLLGENHVRDTADYTPRDQPNEAAGLIYEAAEGRCHAMSHLDDDQRKELSDKVRKVNKQTNSRPR